ncbi:MAG: hypothetical protein ACYDGN_11150 [Acidimicrobiales bacterium]
MQPSLARRWTYWGRAVAVSVACTMAMALAPYGSGAAGAATRQGAAIPEDGSCFSCFYITSGSYPFRSGGLVWNLSFNSYWDGSQSSVGAAISRYTAAGVESHSWEGVKVPPRSFRNEGSGRWKIAPPAAATSPLMQVNLQFVATRHVADSCKTGSKTTYYGTLKGLLKLATGLKTGTVGGKSVSFRAPTTAYLNKKCVPPLYKSPCYGGSSFGAYGGSPSSTPPMFYGFSARVDGISVTKTVKLARPRGAVRTDSVYANEPPVSWSGSTLKVTTKLGSLVTGGAVFRSSGAPQRYRDACYVRGVKHTEVTEYWTRTSYTSSPLRARTVLTGVFSPPKSAQGYTSKTLVG